MRDIKALIAELRQFNHHESADALAQLADKQGAVANLEPPMTSADLLRLATDLAATLAKLRDASDPKERRVSMLREDLCDAASQAESLADYVREQELTMFATLGVLDATHTLVDGIADKLKGMSALDAPDAIHAADCGWHKDWHNCTCGLFDHKGGRDAG